jgi:protein-tyrosine phosphatase
MTTQPNPLSPRGTPRWIALDGPRNAREIAGLRTSDGQQVQPGRLLRSDSLHAATQNDMEILTSDYGVTTLIELRSAEETQHDEPCGLAIHPAIEFWRTPLLRRPPGERGGAVGVQKLVAPRADRSGKSPYFRYISERPMSVVAAIRYISTARGSALVNCAAGKDRTGLVVAFALAAVGVVNEDILEDYMASASRAADVLERLQQTQTYGASLAGRSVDSYTPRVEYLDDVLEEVCRRFGSVYGWLIQRGWQESDATRLRVKLLEVRPAPTTPREKR